MGTAYSALWEKFISIFKESFASINRIPICGETLPLGYNSMSF